MYISLLLMFGCFQWFKDTKMKANHNPSRKYEAQVWLFPMVQRY